MNIYILFSFAQLEEDRIVACVGVPINISQIIADSIGAMFTKDAGGQMAQTLMFPRRRIAPQRALVLDTKPLQPPQEVLIKKWPIFGGAAFGSYFRARAKNILEPHLVNPLEFEAGLGPPAHFRYLGN